MELSNEAHLELEHMQEKWYNLPDTGGCFENV